MTAPSRIKVLLDLLCDVHAEEYAALGPAFAARAENVGVIDLDVDLYDHIERIYRPRIDRLKRLIGEAGR